MAILKVREYFEKWGNERHTKAVEQDVCSQFLKVQQLSQFAYFEKKVRTNLKSDGCRRFFSEKLSFCGKHCGFLDYFLGTKVTTLMCG